MRHPARYRSRPAASSTRFRPCTGRRWASRTRPSSHQASSFRRSSRPHRRARNGMGSGRRVGEVGRAGEAVAAAEAGYPVPVRSFVIISDAHIGALLLAGRSRRGDAPAETMRNARSNSGHFSSSKSARRGRQSGARCGPLDTAISLLTRPRDRADSRRLQRLELPMPDPADHRAGDARVDR